MKDSQLVLLSIIGILTFYTAIIFIFKSVKGKQYEHKVTKPVKKIAIIFGILMLIQLYQILF